MTSVKIVPARNYLMRRLLDCEIRVALLRESYRPSTKHRHLKDIAEYVAGLSDPLTGKTLNDGVFDADDCEIVAEIAGGCSAIALLEYGGEYQSPLLQILVGEEYDLPVYPHAGQRVAIEFDNGNDKIMRIS